MTDEYSQLLQQVRKVLLDLETSKVVAINARAVGVQCLELNDPNHVMPDGPLRIAAAKGFTDVARKELRNQYRSADDVVDEDGDAQLSFLGDELQDRYSVNREGSFDYVRREDLTDAEVRELAERFMKVGDSYQRHGALLLVYLRKRAA